MPPPIDKGKRKAPIAEPTSIDEIFASSSKTLAGSTATSKSKRPTTTYTGDVGGTTVAQGSKKKKKRRKVEASNTEDDQAETGKDEVDLRRTVETVVDPSILKLKPDKEKEQGKEGKKRSKKDLEEDEAFRDSRGTRRKTEEGFLIYKEAELGINPEAGGTPLCPFDCECCF